MAADIDLTTGFVAIIFGFIAAITAYTAGLKYYAGPWKAVVVWMMWGISLSLIRVILTFADEIYNPTIDFIPMWMKFSTTIFAFFCFMNAALAMKSMSDLYSTGGYKKFEEEMSSKLKKR